MVEQYRGAVLHSGPMQCRLRVRLFTWDKFGETVSTHSKRFSSKKNTLREQEVNWASSKAFRSSRKFGPRLKSGNADSETA